MMTEPMLNAREVAQLLRISLPTVYRLVKRGDLPAYRVARLKLVFRTDDVMAYVNAGHVEPAVKVNPPEEA